MVVSDYEVTGEVVGGPNDSLVYDYDATANGLRGYWELRSLSQSGSTTDPPTACRRSTTRRAPGTTARGLTHSTTMISAPRSWLTATSPSAPAAAAGLFGGAENNAGLQPTSFSVAQNTQTGQVTGPRRRRWPGVRPRPPPRTAQLRLVRIHRRQLAAEPRRGRGRAQDVVTDRLRATNGAQHAVDLLLWNDFEEGETGWRFPPYPSEPSRFGDGDLTTKSEMPAAPFTLIADEADDEPDGSLESGFAALTFGTTPEELRWQGDDRFEAQYLLTVPAGGSVQLRNGYSQAFTHLEVLALG